MKVFAWIRNTRLWRPLKTAAAAVAVLAMTNCAMVPSGTGGTQFMRLIFTWTMAGAINPNCVYIVALNPSTSSNPRIRF